MYLIDNCYHLFPSRFRLEMDEPCQIRKNRFGAIVKTLKENNFRLTSPGVVFSESHPLLQTPAEKGKMVIYGLTLK